MKLKEMHQLSFFENGRNHLLIMKYILYEEEVYLYMEGRNK